MKAKKRSGCNVEPMKASHRIKTAGLIVYPRINRKKFNELEVIAVEVVDAHGWPNPAESGQ